MSGLVLVTGATGKTGRSLVTRLREAGVAHRVATRGGERPFDWTRPATWDPVLDGVASVYLVAPPTVDDPYSRLVSFAQSALHKGVRRFVFLSMASLPVGGAAHGQVHRWLADHTEDWAVLGPSAFMQNFSEGTHLATIRDEGTIYSNTGDGRVPFISADDIAHAAFALLTGEGGANRAYVLTGAEALSYDDVAATIGRACGRLISHTRISTQALVERFVTRGLPPTTARFLAAAYERIAAGAHARTSDDFGSLTGVTPQNFRDFAAANASLWGQAG